jgi:hypothetical protein
MTDDRYI